MESCSRPNPYCHNSFRHKKKMHKQQGDCVTLISLLRSKPPPATSTPRIIKKKSKLVTSVMLTHSPLDAPARRTSVITAHLFTVSPSNEVP